MHTQGLMKEKRSSLKIKCVQIPPAGAHTSGSEVVTFDSTSWTKAYFTKMKPTIKNPTISPFGKFWLK